MNRQEQLDRQWHETGYEELGIGFAHDQPISAKEDMNGLIDHEWIRKTRAGILIVHDDPECAAHRCSAYNPIRGKDIEGCFCSCHLPLTPAAALGIAKGIIAEMEHGPGATRANMGDGWFEPNESDPGEMEEYESGPLAAARGCIIGTLIGLSMWAVVGWGLYEWLK